MSDHFQATISALQADLRPLEEQILKKKQLINLLCEHAGLQPIYTDSELKLSPERPANIRGDEFFNKPLNTSVRTVLARRKASGAGPALAEEIFDALVAGGYDKFPPDRSDALNGLRISLGKSSHTFAKLPNGAYGLCEWYDLKRPKGASGNGKAEEIRPAIPVNEVEPDVQTKPEEQIVG